MGICGTSKENCYKCRPYARLQKKSPKILKNQTSSPGRGAGKHALPPRAITEGITTRPQNK